MTSKKTIALLTDFGQKDHYVGILKGVILNITRDVHLVDITHGISPHNVQQGAIALKYAYSYFPKGTVFVCVVDPGVGTERKALAIRTSDYIFVGPDNGLLAPALKDQEVKGIYEITNKKFCLKDISQTFHGRDIFAPVAAHLISGVALSRIGKRCQDYIQLNLPEVVTDKEKNQLYGQVIDIDQFGNILTNIEAKNMKEGSVIKYKKRTFNKLNVSFESGKKSQLVAIIGSKGLVEICLGLSNAAHLLQARIGDRISVTVPSSPRKKSGIIKKEDSDEKKPLTPMDLYSEIAQEIDAPRKNK